MPTVNLPPTHGPARDAAILKRVALGQYDPIRFANVSSMTTGSSGAHSGLFSVFADALSMDGVRINVSAAVQQAIADMLDCSLLTAKLADTLFLSATYTIAPSPQPITATTQAMQEHSARIDAMLARATKGQPVQPGESVQTVGKHWIIDNDTIQFHGGHACNYGWHFLGQSFGGISARAVTPGLHLIQDRGWAHGPSHVDYSQTCVLVSNGCAVDGTPMRLRDVLLTSELAPLAYHGRVMLADALRQQGVPVFPRVMAPPAADVWINVSAPAGCPAELPPITTPTVVAWDTSQAPAPAIASWLQSFGGWPIGSTFRDVVSGVAVLARIECIPNSPSPVVALYLAATRDPATGALTPTPSPPADWPSS